MRYETASILLIALLCIPVLSGQRGQAEDRESIGYIVVHVPPEAKVFINDHVTRSKGADRRYVSYGLRTGSSYHYRIRTEIQRDGKTLKNVRTVTLRAGQTAEIDIAFPSELQRQETLPPPSPEKEVPKADEPEPKADESELKGNTESDESREPASPLNLRRADVGPVYDPHPIERYLKEGKFAEAETELLAKLEENPDDDEIRFSLGVVQFLRGPEGILQAWYRYGLRNNTANVFLPQGARLPFLRLPVPLNPDPEPIRYEQFRGVFQQFLDRMAEAEATLSQVKADDVKLTIHLGRIHFDVNNDGHAGDDEHLWRVFNRVNPNARLTSDNTQGFIVSFDRADAIWLRGYSHLLSAMAEVVLAYDSEELFHRSAHLLYSKPQTPYDFLLEEEQRAHSAYRFLDLIAAVHSVNLSLAEPQRMPRALDHLESVIDLSREMWTVVLAESDDDREWIPGPQQQGVFQNMRVTRQIVDGWLVFLDETEKLLAGKKLAPFWRGKSNSARGVNVRRVFTEPASFDLVAWAHGAAATPYIEEGELTTPAVWNRIQSVFGGRFLTFAVWFN